jgi:hypothetical protein
MQYHQRPICLIVPSGDYLHFLCAKCGGLCEVDYKDLDPAIPLIQLKCQKCGDLGKWKIWNTGAGFLENTKRHKSKLVRARSHRRWLGRGQAPYSLGSA